MRTRSGYQKLPPDREVSSWEDDPRFRIPGPEVPKGAIALAIFLTVFGIFSLVAAWLHFTQQILGKHQAEVGFTILGVMTFVPGAYHSFLAYGTWRGWPGYSWDQIPGL